MRLLPILLAAGLATVAQHRHAPPQTEKPVALLPGLGAHTRAISTKSAEAQQFFNQGLNLLFGFNRYEALRSFRKAAQLDPDAAMPLWGAAMATGPHINMDLDGDVNMKESCQAIAQAMTKKAPPLELELVKAAAVRCPEYEPDRYIDAMRAVFRSNPDDMDAASLLAESMMIPVRWRWFQRNGEPAGQMAEAIAVLEAVLRRYPEHPGANHFYIHAVEMSQTPERAIPASQRLMGIMPGAGHMVHMPGHIWLRTGDWETAAVVNERAAQVDRDYFAKTAVQSSYLGYYMHNLQFVAYARQMQGRAADAIIAAEALVKESLPMVDAMPEMVDAIYSYPLFARVRFARWDDVLAMPKPAEKLSASVALWHWARAQALLRKGQREGAAKEAAQFAQARNSVPAGWPWLVNKAADVLAVADHWLQASLAERAADAVPHWSSAAKLQDGLGYDEPPPWYFPVREKLGVALLEAGRPADAEAAFREGLAESPRNGRMLFGLMTALTRQGKREAAAMVKREFDTAWRRADSEPDIQR